MKLHTNDNEHDPANYCRNYYVGCYVEVATELQTYVGIVTSVEPDRMSGRVVPSPGFLADGIETVWHWSSQDHNTKFRRINKREYMLYKLKGYSLPEEFND